MVDLDGRDGAFGWMLMAMRASGSEDQAREDIALRKKATTCISGFIQPLVIVANPPTTGSHAHLYGLISRYPRTIRAPFRPGLERFHAAWKILLIRIAELIVN